MDGKREIGVAVCRSSIAAVIFLTIATVLHADETAPITVYGQTLDANFKPIASAKVYVASKSPNSKLLAETKSDAEGRYEFKDLKLPVERLHNGSSDEPAALASEVFGQADGYGFDWRGGQSQFNDNPFAAPKFVAKIAINLIFPDAAKIGGRIVDEAGQPIAGAQLQIRYAGHVIRIGTKGDFDESDTPGERGAFESLEAKNIVPTGMIQRKSDDDGHFEFAGLPANCSFRIRVQANKFSDRTIWATAKESHGGEGQPLFVDGMTVTLFKPIAVPVQVQYGDTDKPAAGVLVSGGNENCTFVETTDDQGRVTLQIPPGHYQASVLAALGSPYLSLDSMQQNAVEFDVERKQPAAPLVYRLPPAAVVEATLIDPITGAGVKGLKLWQSDPAMPLDHREIFYRSWEAATHVAHAQLSHDRRRWQTAGLVCPRPIPHRRRLAASARRLRSAGSQRPGGRSAGRRTDEAHISYRQDSLVFAPPRARKDFSEIALTGRKPTDIFNHMVKYFRKPLNRVFFALSDPTRRAILMRVAHGELTVTALAAPFAISLVAVSKHIRVLESAGLLKRTKQGREYHLQFVSQPLHEASQWFEQFDRFWTSELDSIKEIAERKARERAKLKKPE